MVGCALHLTVSTRRSFPAALPRFQQQKSALFPLLHHFSHSRRSSNVLLLPDVLPACVLALARTFGGASPFLLEMRSQPAVSVAPSVPPRTCLVRPSEAKSRRCSNSGILPSSVTFNGTSGIKARPNNWTRCGLRDNK